MAGCDRRENGNGCASLPVRDSAECSVWYLDYRVSSLTLIGIEAEGEASDEELNRRIGHLLRQVHASLPHVLQALPSYPGFAKLTAEQRGALEKAISSARPGA